MGGLSGLLQNNPELLEYIRQQQGQGGTPGGTPPPGGPGVLAMLPQGHQQAAMAPPPIPGGDFNALGPYAQQALGMAGVQPQPQQPPQAGGMPPQPAGGFPGGGGGMPPGIRGGMPGKGSPFGGDVERGGVPGLLGRARR